MARVNRPTSLLECRGPEASVSAGELVSWHCELNRMSRWAPVVVACGPGVKDEEEKRMRHGWEETVH